MVVSEKGIIQQFNLVIYPVDFVVVIGELEEEVNKLYMPYEEEYKDAHIAPPRNTGCTYRVKERETDIPCVLVWFGKVEEFTGSIVTHEANHAAFEIFQYIGAQINFNDQEPFCYLSGNLARLAIGSFYEIPGIKPPTIKKDVFENPERPKKSKTTKRK